VFDANPVNNNNIGTKKNLKGRKQVLK